MTEAVSLSHNLLKPIFAFDNPLMIMLSLEGGISIYSRVLNGKISKDPQLVCGGLHALSLFMGEVLERKDPINRIILDEYEIFITRVDEITIYYMFIGDEQVSISKLADFINKMNKKRYWKKLMQGKFEISTRMSNLIDKIVNTSFLN